MRSGGRWAVSRTGGSRSCPLPPRASWCAGALVRERARVAWADLLEVERPSPGAGRAALSALWSLRRLPVAARGRSASSGSQGRRSSARALGISLTEADARWGRATATASGRGWRSAAASAAEPRGDRLSRPPLARGGRRARAARCWPPRAGRGLARWRARGRPRCPRRQRDRAAARPGATVVGWARSTAGAFASQAARRHRQLTERTSICAIRRPGPTWPSRAGARCAAPGWLCPGQPRGQRGPGARRSPRRSGPRPGRCWSCSRVGQLHPPAGRAGERRHRQRRAMPGRSSAAAATCPRPTGGPRPSLGPTVLPVDTVLVDPPREGLDERSLALCAAAAAAGVRVVRPADPGRRHGPAAAAGHAADGARAFDLMPQTHHVEVVALFTARPACGERRRRGSPTSG